MTTFDFTAEARAYRRLLTDNLLPWWLGHALDQEHGGVCSCIADDGTILSHDKYIWSQVRALWTFAAAYQRVERRGEYLDTARKLFDFCVRHGRDGQGDWRFRVSRTGQEIDGPLSIQTDAFALCAMVEYARAAGEERAVTIARQTFARTLSKLQQPGSYRTAPYPIPPGTKAQRVSMQFSLAYHELAKLTGDARAAEEAMKLTDDVLDHFRRPELRACLEYLHLDNTVPPPPIGTYFSAGHGIETAWFQIVNLRPRKFPHKPGPSTGRNHSDPRLRKACDIMRWSFERGWDGEYGGLFLGGDLRGGEPFLPNADTKIWWPHAEALCGALLAYEVCRQDWCLQWYRRTYDWALAHFPDHEHGEWTQRLDRRGRKIDKVVALPVKDPFHLPRAVIYAIEALERLAGKKTPAESRL